MKSSRLNDPMGNALRKRLKDKKIVEERGFSTLVLDPKLYLDHPPASIGNENEVTAAFRICLKALLSSYIDEIYWRTEAVMKICESPIEAVMLSAFILLSVEKGFALQVKVKRSNDRLLLKYPPSNPFPRITITPQAQIGDYRLDFHLEYEDNIFVPFLNKRGIKIPKSMDVKSELLVECDGHDFHEKTKDQARKDKRRDRTLQSLGFYVFRFTGSEIWKDPIRCADEVFSQLQKVSRDG